MPLQVVVKIPVYLYSYPNEDQPDNPIANMVVSKKVILPFDFVPNSLDLAHCQSGDGNFTLHLFARVKSVQWSELTGEVTVFCEQQEWHDKSFAEAIEKMPQSGWEIKYL